MCGRLLIKCSGGTVASRDGQGGWRRVGSTRVKSVITTLSISIPVLARTTKEFGLHCGLNALPRRATGQCAVYKEPIVYRRREFIAGLEPPCPCKLRPAASMQASNRRVDASLEPPYPRWPQTAASPHDPERPRKAVSTQVIRDASGDCRPAGYDRSPVARRQRILRGSQQWLRTACEKAEAMPRLSSKCHQARSPQNSKRLVTKMDAK